VASARAGRAKRAAPAVKPGLRPLPAEPAPPIVFGAPLIGEEEIAEVVDTLRSGWLGTGPKTKRFEREFADFVGARFAVATNSCTAALHLALVGLGVGPGDEVITTPLTFIATANVIEHCGATPVFADVCGHDGNIDPEQVEARMTPRTKAIMPVHYAGAPAAVRTLRDRHPDLAIVVDAAHSVELVDRGGESAAAAQGATCSAFSFYVTKNLTTGEGGMLVTDSAELAADARVRSLHGLDNDAWQRYSGGRYQTYEGVNAGFKYNMTDLQASLGIHQLARIEQSHVRRREIWERYNDAFNDLEGIEIPPVSLEAPLDRRHARHLYTLWFRWEELGLDRHDVVEALADLGVGVGWHFRSVHLQRFYRERYGYEPGAYPVAEAIAEKTLSIPFSAALTDAEVARVIAAVRSVVS
jgi:dTDP-4-amino-4,6-dideoxygalactose transaminase